MSQKNPFSKNPFSDFFARNEFSNIFDNCQSSPFDLKALLETQRKNLQAIAQAQSITLENIQAVARRQAEIMAQVAEDNSAMARELLSEGTPEEKIAKNADLFKSVYERSIKNLQDISEMIGRSHEESSEIINKRVSATMSEIKTAVENSEKGKKAA